MDEMSRCGERRALNARERSGDATSGDATARRVRQQPAQALEFCWHSERSGRYECSRKAGVVLQAYRLTSFCEARLLLELRVLAYGLSLTDRPTAVPPPTQQPARPLSTRCNQSPEPTESARGQRGGTSGFLTEGGLPRHACPPAVREAAPVAF